MLQSSDKHFFFVYEGLYAFKKWNFPQFLCLLLLQVIMNLLQKNADPWLEDFEGR